MADRSWASMALVVWCVGCGGGTTPVDGGGGDAATDLGPPDGGGATCHGASDCEDGTYCNGAATCVGGACVAGTPPCSASQTCDERARACLSDCDIHGDADGDGHRATSCGGDDCDDADPLRYPGNPEVCDSIGHDDDCNLTTLGPDRDGDGFVSVACCNAEHGAAPVCGADCDDTSHDISPSAPEVCDGVDDDCNGMIDEGVTTTFYRDLDGDRYGDTTMVRDGCSATAGYVLLPGDCNDADPMVHPGVSDTCNMLDDDCDGTPDPGCVCTVGATRACGTSDGAGGFLSVGACHPGTQTCALGAWGACMGAVSPLPESCDGVDDDCDGATDEMVQLTFYADTDADGYGNAGVTAMACAAPTGFVLGTGDCDDSDPHVHQGAVEVCDGVDDNCDGRVDEGVRIAFYRDNDGDTYGNPLMSVDACSAPTGFVSRPGDCDDTNVAIHVGVTDVCDGIDNDCDGAENPTCACVNGTMRTCGTGDGMGGYLMVGPCHPGMQTCTAGSWGACTGSVSPATETCNSIDDDCDGTPDDGVLIGYHRDCDGDGYGASTMATFACMPPGTPPSCGAMTGTWVPNSGDCNDGSPTTFPGAPETCNGGDDDCDSIADGPPATAACNALMPRNTLAGATCTGGRCTYACAPGFLDCDTTMSTYGCEIDGSASATNCATCGHACWVGGCSGGVCTRELTDVSAGHGTTCARRRSGAVLCWGLNADGEVGDGTTTDRTAPGDITLTNAVQVSVGDRHVCAVRAGGAVACWGANDLGQCGTGAMSPSVAMPTNVAGISDATRVAAGGTFTCALRATGAVVCWGSPGAAGSLGDGTTMVRLTPTPVAGLTDAVEIAVGFSTGYARRTDGTVVAWGDDTYGQVGNSVVTTTPVMSPTQVMSNTGAMLAGVLQIAAGSYHACARLATEVRCWGWHLDGRLGDGGMDPTGHPSAQPVTGLSDAVKIAAANGGNVAVRADGTVVTWGQAYCGDGFPANCATFTPPLDGVGMALVGAVSIAGGGAGSAATGGTCALMPDRLACWGSNDHGQVGNGAMLAAPRPVSAIVPP